MVGFTKGNNAGIEAMNKRAEGQKVERTFRFDIETCAHLGSFGRDVR
jgi:hypothetical protein